MTILQCQKCYTGNIASAAACHNCGARLQPSGGTKGTALGGQVTVRDEDVHDAHILDTALSAQRSREARTARFWLTFAAILYLLRVALVPILAAFAKPETFAPFCGPHVTPIHYVCLVVFGFCALWARREPLTATLTAGVLFLFAAVPGFIENPTVSGGALVGKLLMIGIVGRAVSAAIMYRSYCSRPNLVPDAPKSKAPPSPTRPPSDRIAA